MFASSEVRVPDVSHNALAVPAECADTGLRLALPSAPTGALGPSTLCRALKFLDEVRERQFDSLGIAGASAESRSGVHCI